MSRRLLVTTMTLILCSALAGITAAQESMMPKPGPEYEALGFFAGTWRFEGEAMESPMGPAGKVTFTESCEWLQGGFALVCRSEGMNPTGPGSAIAISSYDPEQKAYTYYAAESNMPPFMATGQRKGKVWTYHMESNMGDMTMMTRVTIAETSATSYSFEMETSTDGKTWTRVMEGTSRKSGS
jgi:hypothetical protein